ncbi:MAG TPA: carboxypeptidase-like regulatory domain-containing protein [Longimicrobium sp.]
MIAIRTTFIALLLAVAIAHAGRAAAQVGMGGVHGRALAAASRAPVAYALVRLIPVGFNVPVRSTLTDGQGGFAFIAVIPGTYRLRLERVGYSAEQTEAFAVAADQRVERIIRSVPRAIAIAPIVATSGCRTDVNLQNDPALATLWNEAVKGMELRRAFDDQYRYEFDQNQYHTMSLQNSGAPDSLKRHVTLDPRTRMNRNREGWGQVRPNSMTLEVPDGREILDPAFLRLHCLDAGLDEAAGVYTIGFRPRRERRGHVDIRGELRLDRRTFQVTSLQVEWTDVTHVLLEATVEFGDAEVPGGTVRMPVIAFFSGHAPESMNLGEIRGEVQFVNYGNLQKVRGP